jgi:antitoxin VapB
MRIAVSLAYMAQRKGLISANFQQQKYILYIYLKTLRWRLVSMATTKIFKSGNSWAVRIPSEMAYDRTDVELTVERVGDEIRIRPVRRLTGLGDKFHGFSDDFMEDRCDEEDQEREGL